MRLPPAPFPLVRPGELVALLTPHHAGVDLLHEHVLVNGAHHLARRRVDGLRHRVREEEGQLAVVFVGEVGGVHLKLFCVPFLFSQSLYRCTETVNQLFQVTYSSYWHRTHTRR